MIRFARRLLIPLVATIPWVTTASAAPTLRLAVLELRDSSNAGAAGMAYLTDLVRGSASRALPSERACVLTRESLEPLLPAGTTLAECADGACEVEIGRRVGADYVVSGELLRFGGALRLLLKLHHCRSGAFLGSEPVAGPDLPALERGLSDAADRLWARLKQHAGIVPATPPAETPAARAVHDTLFVADSVPEPTRRRHERSSRRVTATRPVPLAGSTQTIVHLSADRSVVVGEEFMWTASDNGRDLDWHEAWQWCAQCRAGGWSDWRLPAIEELEALNAPAAADEHGASTRTRILLAEEFQLSARLLWTVSMASAGVGLQLDAGHGTRVAAPFADRRGARVICVRRRTD